MSEVVAEVSWVRRAFCVVAKLTLGSFMACLSIVGAHAEVPSDLRGLLGYWDGAFVYRDNDVRQVSFNIQPTTSSAQDAVFDIAMMVGGSEYRMTGFWDEHYDSPRIEFSNDAIEVALYRDIKVNSGTESITFYVKMRGDARGFASRRPQVRGDKAIFFWCREIYEPLATTQQTTNDIVRDLQIEFYPALMGYAPEVGPVSAAIARSGLSSADFAELLFDCMATGVNSRGMNRLGIFEDMIDSAAIVNAQYAFGRAGIGLEKLVVPHGVQLPAVAPAGKKSKSRDVGLDPADEYLTIADLLSDLETASAAQKFTAMSPASVFTALRPYGERLVALEQTLAVNQNALLQQQAAARMQGVTRPAIIPVEYQPLFGALESGTTFFFGAPEMAFLGGFVAGSIEVCDRPSDIGQRLRLLGLFVQGIDRAIFGDSFSSPFSEFLQNSVRENATYQQGYQLPELMACQPAYLDAVLANLADIAEQRGSQGQRASLYIRSCSIDRKEAQCDCMANQMRSVLPGIDFVEYDRAQIDRVINANPLVGMRLVAQCRVQ